MKESRASLSIVKRSLTVLGVAATALVPAAHADSDGRRMDTREGLAALMAGAAGVALAHNHPNGTPTPSQEDFDMTDRLQRTLSELGLELVDHCVVARSNFTSIGRLRSGSLRKRY